MLLWWLLIMVVAVTGQPTSRVCSSVDIRNMPDKLESLRGCRVVEGHVHVVLMERCNETDFDRHSLPELREITEYLMFYRVAGLRSIGKIFPNLTLIRGETLFHDYALVINEMFNLQEVGLSSLADITRGAVRIEKNPSLCYVQTVDWDRIAHWDPLKNYISHNKSPVSCRGCESRCPHGLCWSRSQCQIQNDAYSECHPLCIGGCSGHGPRGCYTCRKYLTNDNKCVDHCSNGTYQYLSRRCITEDECLSITSRDDSWSPGVTTPSAHKFLTFNGTCTDRCPSGYQLVAELKACVPCPGGKCSKWCPAWSIESIADAQDLEGCTHIQGSLEITIKMGKPKIVAQELEKYLGSIEEIEGCLKIVRSSPIINLHFLRNLTTIHGDYGESCAMLVMENQNLQELWNWDTKSDFKILKNRLFFHYNPKLCMHHILRLIAITHQENVTNLEVAKESNGDKFPCDVEVIELSVTHRLFNLIEIHIPCIKTDSQSSFLRYEIHFTKDPSRNISMFDDLDQCSDYGWRIKDISIDLKDKHGEHINLHGLDVTLTELEANMQYAYYVTAYTVDRIVASSKMHYTSTLPTTPSELVSAQAYPISSSEIVVSWDPPRHVNGKLEEYVVTWTLQEKYESLVTLRDYCENPMIYMDDPTTNKPDMPRLSLNKLSCCPSEPVIIPKDGFEKLCSRFDQTTLPVGFTQVEPGQTCESFFNKYIYHSAIKHYTSKAIHTSFKKTEVRRHDKSNYHLNVSKSNNTNEATMLDVISLPATDNNFTIRNAKHFHDYIVTVKACRERHPEEPDLSEGYRCSKTEIISVRTLKIKDADLISNGIYYEVLNKTLHVYWDAPVHPNGLLVAFELEYRQRQVLNPKSITYCIPFLEYTSNNQSYAVLDLLPGNYEFRIRAVSLAGKGPFTEFRSFKISRAFAMSDHAMVTVTVTIIAVVIILGTLSLMYLQKKKINLDKVLIASVNPQYPYVLDRWELQKEDIICIREVGFGTFGKVYKGILLPDNIPCAVKTFNEQASSYDAHISLNEASIMKSVSGAYHIVRLLGVVSREKPPLVVMELMDLGDLRSYLMSVRNTDPPCEAIKLRMAAQIADGMCFMEAKKFVHRDLAARNCLVNKDLTVKVGDFGMTRDIYETDYYRKGDRGLLPIRWMSPESLQDGLFTSQSDVWSYGVVLWEIVTLGEQPYQGSSNEVVLREVMAGRIRLDIPHYCPNLLKILMISSWRSRPSQRINFMQAVGSLDYFVDNKFKMVSYYHSDEAINIRKGLSDYVEILSVEDPLLSEYPNKSMDGGIALLLSRPPPQKFSLKLKTVPEDDDSSESCTEST